MQTNVKHEFYFRCILYGVYWVFIVSTLSIPDSFSYGSVKAIRCCMNRKGTVTIGTVRWHISNIRIRGLAERAWCTKSQSSLLNIYFRLCGFQYSLLLIYFCCGLCRRLVMRAGKHHSWKQRCCMLCWAWPCKIVLFLLFANCDWINYCDVCIGQ